MTPCRLASVSANADAGAHRRAARLAGEVAQAAHAFGHQCKTGSVAVGAGLAIATDAQHDQPWVQRQQRVGAEAPAFHRAGAEVLDQHVGLGPPAHAPPPARRAASGPARWSACCATAPATRPRCRLSPGATGAGGRRSWAARPSPRRRQSRPGSWRQTGLQSAGPAPPPSARRGAPWGHGGGSCLLFGGGLGGRLLGQHRVEVSSRSRLRSCP